MRARSAPSGSRRRRRSARRAIVELLRSWGGATIAYRRRLIDSPSYTLNHEEVEKALEEGIRFAEGLTPLAVEVDEAGHAIGLTVDVQRRRSDGGCAATHAAACAHHPGRRRHAAQHRARARRRGAFPSRRQVLRAARRGGSRSRSRCAASPSRRFRPCSRACATTAARSAFSATCIRRSSATSSRRWRAPSRATRSCRGCLHAWAPPIRAPMPISSRHSMRNGAHASSG